MYHFKTSCVPIMVHALQVKNHCTRVSLQKSRFKIDIDSSQSAYISLENAKVRGALSFHFH